MELDPPVSWFISSSGRASARVIVTLPSGRSSSSATIIAIAVVMPWPTSARSTAKLAVPRAEVGQGMTTAIAMMVAEELDLPLGKVTITLADARPELEINQLTGGSNSMRSMYLPVRTAAAIARQRLVDTAAAKWSADATRLTTKDGVVTGPDGQTATYGELAADAAAGPTVSVTAQLKPESDFTILGTPQSRIDAGDIVTGRKQFTMDLQVPGAKPTMAARPPTINGTVVSVNNGRAVLAMPGVTDIAVLPHGVAIRAETFGQCIDAIGMIDVTWDPGTVAGQSDDTVEAQLNAALPDLTAPLSLIADSVDAEFFFAFASNSPLEPDNAIADVRSDRAEIWSSLKAPIVAQSEIAAALGLPVSAVTVHVTEAGGSFGRHLFHDAALEAAQASKKMGKPVKLSWSRTDSFRQGRTHPMCVSRVRASYALGNVLAYEQRHAERADGFRAGLGDIGHGDRVEAARRRRPGPLADDLRAHAVVPYDSGSRSRR